MISILLHNLVYNKPEKFKTMGGMVPGSMILIQLKGEFLVQKKISTFC